MTNDEAIRIVSEIPKDSDGTWFQLRLGRDPGPRRILQLRLALRVAWRALKDQHAIPFPVAAGAAAILHFVAEAESNLPGGVRVELVEFEIPDLVQGAFDLLLGADADSWVVPRHDLGE